MIAQEIKFKFISFPDVRQKSSKYLWNKQHLSSPAIPLYLGHPKMSISESSLPVQYANWQEELLLKRKLNTLDNNERQKLREIYTEQRLVIKKFHTKLCSSRLIQARMVGDRDTERQLRSQMNRKADLEGMLCASPVRKGMITHQPTPNYSMQNTDGKHRNITGKHHLTHLQRQSSIPDSGYLSYVTGSSLRRPNTVAGTSSQSGLNGGERLLMRKSSSHDELRTTPASRRKIFQNHNLKPGICNPAIPSQTPPVALEPENTTSPALVVSDGPFANRIKNFCKSIEPYSVKKQTTQTDYYANILTGILDEPITESTQIQPLTTPSVAVKIPTEHDN